MANGTMGLLGDALGNPLIGLGAGLLAHRPGSTFGQALGQGIQFASGLQHQAARNELLREGLVAKKAQREQMAQRQAANQRLIALLTGEGGQPDGAPPISLLEGFPGMEGPRPPIANDEGGAVPGVSPPQQMNQRQFLGLLAEAYPEQFGQGLLGQIFAAPQKPTSFQRDFEYLTRVVGLSETDALDRLRKGTTVNVNAGGEEPLKPSDLLKFRLPDGTTPPIGATASDVRSMGGVLMTNEQQKALDAANKYGPVMDRIEELALGEEGIFADIRPGLGNRVQSAWDLFIGSLTRENPNVSLYDDLANSTLAPLIKQFGESGALAEGDVERAMGLLPRIRSDFLLPDTREEAVQKLNTLRNILERGEKNLRKKLGQGGSSTSSSGGSGVTIGGNTYSREDLEFTAKKHGMTVDEVIKSLERAADR